MTKSFNTNMSFDNSINQICSLKQFYIELGWMPKFLQEIYDPLIRVYFRASPGTNVEISAGVCRTFPTPFFYHTVQPLNHQNVIVPGAHKVGGIVRKTPGVTAECENGINAGISNVQIQYKGLKTGCFPYIPAHFPTNPYTIITLNGQYSTWVPPHYQYVITPYKNSRCDCGLDYGDLDFVRRIILGIVEEPTLAQLIASDFNGNGFVSTFDMVNMIQCLNGMWNPPVGWSSWRFIPIIVYNWNNPYGGVDLNALPSSITTPVVTGNQLNHQFYGIKRGDIDGSCSDCDDQYSPMKEPPVADRVNLNIFLESEDIELHKRDIKTFSVSINQNILDVFLFNFEFSYNSNIIEIVDIEPIGISNEYFMKYTDESGFNIIWFSSHANGETFESNSDLFNVTIRSKVDKIKTSKAIWYRDHGGNRLYCQGGEVKVQWNWKSGQNLKEIKVQALGPNPTKSEFTLAITTPNEERADILIYDIQGKLCKEKYFQLQEGYHLLTLADLPIQPGVYILQLSIGKHRLVSRIVKF